MSGTKVNKSSYHDRCNECKEANIPADELDEGFAEVVEDYANGWVRIEYHLNRYGKTIRIDKVWHERKEGKYHE